MLTKKLADVDLIDIKTLCENKALESRFLDFKADAIGAGEKDKREFLADISAFANASGGDLVLGVKTKDGAADEICGIDLDDPDKEKLRLGNIIRDGLEPRVSGIDMAWLPFAGKKGVMVISVPRSWSAPHRVTFLRDMNFYARNAAGKNPMSVDELRQSFNLSRDFAERLRGFRAQRIQAILDKDLPFQLREGAKLVLHFVPLSTVADPLDLQFKQGAPGIVPPLRKDSYSWLHTIEGYVTYTMPEPSRSYSMMFRDGAVEGVAGIDPNQSDSEVSLHAVERIRSRWLEDIPRLRRRIRRAATSVCLRHSSRCARARSRRLVDWLREPDGRQKGCAYPFRGRDRCRPVRERAGKTIQTPIRHRRQRVRSIWVTELQRQGRVHRVTHCRSPSPGGGWPPGALITTRVQSRDPTDHEITRGMHLRPCRMGLLRERVAACIIRLKRG